MELIRNYKRLDGRIFQLAFFGFQDQYCQVEIFNCNAPNVTGYTWLNDAE